MAADNDRFEIDITPDKPTEANRDASADIVVIDDIESADEFTKDPRKALKKLEKKLKKEKEARREAEERARIASFHAQKATVEVGDTHIHLVNNAIENLRRDNEILTANYAESMRNGDYETGARIQSTINQNEVNLKELHDGQIRMQQEARSQPPLPPVPPKPVDFETKIDQLIKEVSKPSGQWLKANRDYLNDERSLNKMYRAHQDAVEEGIQPDTPAYFNYVENRLGIGSGDNGGSPMSSASRPSSRQAAPPSAPVNRDKGGRDKGATLSSAEAEMAKSWGWSPREYYDHKMAMKKDGRLN